MERVARERAQEVVAAAATKLGNAIDPSVTITKEILTVSPKSAILEIADNWKADLIVVGSHGYGALQRFQLGSVSQAVVSHAKCSVEVVSCRDANDSSDRVKGA